MDPCVPQGATLGLGLFNTSTNDLDDKTDSMLIKSADDASQERATHSSENRPGIENYFNSMIQFNKCKLYPQPGLVY